MRLGEIGCPRVLVDVGEGVRPVDRHRRRLGAGDDPDLPVAELEERGGRRPRAADVVGPDGVALDVVPADERHAAARSAEAADLRAHARRVCGVGGPGARQDERADALRAQQRDVAHLVAPVGADVAERDEAPRLLRDAEDAGEDLDEVRVVHVQREDADRVGLDPHERLGVRVRDVVELLGRREHADPQVLGDAPVVAVEDTRRRRGRDARESAHVGEGRRTRAALVVVCRCVGHPVAAGSSPRGE